MDKGKEYNLEERTTKFSLEIIKFLRGIQRDPINRPIITQLTKSATSIGANYREANGASSKKDFKNKIYICKKESRETKYWLEIMAEDNPKHKVHCRKLWQEAQELTLIFSKITQTIEKNK